MGRPFELGPRKPRSLSSKIRCNAYESLRVEIKSQSLGLVNKNKLTKYGAAGLRKFIETTWVLRPGTQPTPRFAEILEGAARIARGVKDRPSERQERH